MQRSFLQMLKSGKIDIANEYDKLYAIFYGIDKRDGKSIADLLSDNFSDVPFRGTCLSLKEFDQTYGFDFFDHRHINDIDYLVRFAEYIYNFVSVMHERFFFSTHYNQSTILSHIVVVIEQIGYAQAYEDGFTLFVPKDNVATAVSESALIPENVSYRIISFNHHSMKGNFEEKRQTLLVLADLLEPRRPDLEKIEKQFTSDLFYAFNNFHIRHNNTDPMGAKFKKPVADLSNEELEQWYDEVFQMCLLAFMRLEHAERKENFDIFKNKIENKV